MIRTFAAALIAPAVLAAPAIAQASPIGPAVGAEAPALSALLPDGSVASLDALEGENGTVLVFFRSADWCPYCKKQLKELKAAVAPLEAKGWALAAVSYDDIETQQAFATKEALGYPLLSDPGSATIIAYDLLNKEQREGSRFYGIPYPAIVFVGADGTVKAVLREEGYKHRPPVEVVLETADTLATAS